LTAGGDDVHVDAATFGCSSLHSISLDPHRERVLERSAALDTDVLRIGTSDSEHEQRAATRRESTAQREQRSAG
jgi:hypothetical protein